MCVLFFNFITVEMKQGAFYSFIKLDMKQAVIVTNNAMYVHWTIHNEKFQPGRKELNKEVKFFFLAKTK